MDGNEWQCPNDISETKDVIDESQEIPNDITKQAIHEATHDINLQTAYSVDDLLSCLSDPDEEDDQDEYVEKLR